MEYTREDYNNEPVCYCRNCLSLRIKTEDGLEYCDKCGSTDTCECHIDEWERIYYKRFGKNFTDYGRKG